MIQSVTLYLFGKQIEVHRSALSRGVAEIVVSLVTNPGTSDAKSFRLTDGAVSPGDNAWDVRLAFNLVKDVIKDDRVSPNEATNGELKKATNELFDAVRLVAGF